MTIIIPYHEREIDKWCSAFYLKLYSSEHEAPITVVDYLMRTVQFLPGMDTGFRGEGGTGEGRRFDLSLPGGVVSDLQNVPI